MVSLGDILVGGKRPDTAEDYLSSIVFGLNKETGQSKKFIFDDWEVEVGIEEFIVARSTTPYSKEVIHKMGYNACEKALDILSAQGQGAYTIVEPYHRHIVFGTTNEKNFLDIHDISDLSINMSVEMSITDKDGNIIPTPPPPQPTWNCAFRYYRFFKTSNNMYDAYRWLYLMLEMLLQTIKPIKLNPSGKAAEGERAWLEQALRHADSAFNWSSSVNWSTSDNIAYFLRNQYDNIRCNLFHAKGGHILPNDLLGAQSVYKALLELESLCLHLLYSLYSIQSVHGGVTYKGFELMMKAGFGDTIGFICDIATSPQDREKGINLSGAYLSLEQDLSASNTSLGIDTRVYVTEHIPEKYSIKSYGIKKQDDVLELGGLGNIALSFNGVDKLALYFQTRMVNRENSKHYL